MKATLLFVLALFVAISVTSTPAAQAGTASGQVVTCPAGDPLEDFPVGIWIDGSVVDTVYTNGSGVWSYTFSGGDCGSILTAVLGMGSVHSPYDEAYCPLGRHSTPPNCCEQVVGTIPCSGNLGLDDLELRCGYAGAPPCPSQ